MSSLPLAVDAAIPRSEPATVNAPSTNASRSEQATTSDGPIDMISDQLMSGLLHEINSPLGSLRCAADSLVQMVSQCFGALSGCGEDEGQPLNQTQAARRQRLAKDLGQIMSTSIQQISELVGGVGLFVGLDKGEKDSQDLRANLECAIRMASSLTKSNITIAKVLPPTPIYVHASHKRLNAVFINLLKNAIEHARSERGRVSVRLEETETTSSIVIKDNGPGMTEEQIEEAMSPSFGDKDGRVHFGLGLAASKRVVEQEGGRLTIDSVPGKGLTVVVTLPHD